MPTVLAIAAHPDDIEFSMAGTMLLLQRNGWDLHCINLADGSCGSTELSPIETAKLRSVEAHRAADLLGASLHPSIFHDIEIEYSIEALRKLASLVRRVDPLIVLTHSPVDYMVDHEQACRLAVSAAFVRSMPNFHVIPPTDPVPGPIAVYHAQPHGNRTPLGEFVSPSMVVNIQDVIDQKEAALRAHASQQNWLSSSQRLGTPGQAMRAFAREVGSASGRFEMAEGWRQHFFLGFGDEGWNPLAETLGARCAVLV